MPTAFSAKEALACIVSASLSIFHRFETKRSTEYLGIDSKFTAPAPFRCCALCVWTELSLKSVFEVLALAPYAVCFVLLRSSHLPSFDAAFFHSGSSVH